MEDPETQWQTKTKTKPEGNGNLKNRELKFFSGVKVRREKFKNENALKLTMGSKAHMLFKLVATRTTLNTRPERFLRIIIIY